jgi:hypothetical protein
LKAERPAIENPAGVSTVDEVLGPLGGTATLDILGISDEDLQLGRADTDLFETLRITHVVLIQLRDHGVLEAFLQLPKGDQASFLRRIGMTDDPALRTTRTETLISALRASPLGPEESP